MEPVYNKILSYAEIIAKLHYVGGFLYLPEILHVYSCMLCFRIKICVYNAHFQNVRYLICVSTIMKDFLLLCESNTRILNK